MDGCAFSDLASESAPGLQSPVELRLVNIPRLTGRRAEGKQLTYVVFGGAGGWRRSFRPSRHSRHSSMFNKLNKRYEPSTNPTLSNRPSPRGESDSPRLLHPLPLCVDSSPCLFRVHFSERYHPSANAFALSSTLHEDETVPAPSGANGAGLLLP